METIKELNTATHDKQAKASGVGANALWDGPLDTSALPKGKGSSSGIYGKILKGNRPVGGLNAPITQKAKC